MGVLLVGLYCQPAPELRMEGRSGGQWAQAQDRSPTLIRSALALSCSPLSGLGAPCQLATLYHSQGRMNACVLFFFFCVTHFLG